MPGRLTLPNIITGGNLTAGFLALLALERGAIGLAAALVAVAAICDVLDGIVARRGSWESAFGANLDSLADVVSFGAVPAFALHAGPLRSLGGVGTAACAAFLVAGAWRLARYPLVKESAVFVGLPIPLAGGLVMLLVLFASPPVVTIVLVVVLSGLMVSTLPCPTVGIAVRWLASLGGARRPSQRAGDGRRHAAGRGSADRPRRLRAAPWSGRRRADHPEVRSRRRRRLLPAHQRARNRPR